MTAARSALIVATSQYADRRLPPLEGPAQDADALRGVLAHKDIGGFDVRVALNSRVDTLRRTLETFFVDRARDDLLLVHFSGHGLKDDDGQLYLAAADTQIDRLLSTGIDAAWVNRLMSRCRSEKIALFLDCCFAGAFTAGLTRRVGVDTAGVKDHFNGSGLFVITASDAMQYSFEGGHQVGQPPEPSPFTKALVEGLRTGEADRNEDGEVSVNELFDYLEDRIRETSPAQTPTKSAFNQTGDWVIARSTRTPSIRLLPEEIQRQLKSEDALDRLAALIDLRDLADGPDRRVAEAAVQALGALAQDDSRRVAALAQRLLDDEAARPRSAGRGRRRASASPDRAGNVAAPAANAGATGAADAAPGTTDAAADDRAPIPVRIEPSSDRPEPVAVPVVPDVVAAVPAGAANAPAEADEAVPVGARGVAEAAQLDAPPEPEPVAPMPPQPVPIAPPPGTIATRPGPIAAQPDPVASPAAPPEPVAATRAAPATGAAERPAIPASMAAFASTPVVDTSATSPFGTAMPSVPPGPAWATPAVVRPDSPAMWPGSSPVPGSPSTSVGGPGMTMGPPPEATWSPGPTGSVVVIRDVPATAGAGRAVAAPWSLGRAAGRAAIGSVLWVLLQLGWFIYAHPGVLDNPDDAALVEHVFGDLLALIAICVTVVVAVAEYAEPRLRLPFGAAYRVVGGNRWFAAGVLGLITGLTIGLAIEYVYINGQGGSTDGTLTEIAVCAPIGFLVAEALVGRRSATNQGKRSPAT